ncbi:uncharacterized protein V1516DRAFT_670143 [Lipomyces oligophaga]|uniref:uncharacterized protein n=1 Tax=Lipomyces oligophaga TaxID=45792 RepID=UPI0034D01443
MSEAADPLTEIDSERVARAEDELEHAHAAEQAHSDDAPAIPDTTSTVGSDDEADTAPLLTSETTNEYPDPTNPENVNRIFASDDAAAEADNAEATAAAAKKLLYKKIIIGVASFLLFILVVEGIWKLAHRGASAGARPDVVCDSPECIKIAGNVLADMDTTADPCDDFFQYSCGGWLSSHDIAPDRGDYFTSTIMYEESLRLSRNILEGSFTQAEADREIWTKATGVYRACMDTDRIADLGAAPLWPILESIQRMYPIYQTADASLGPETVKTWLEGPFSAHAKSVAASTTAHEVRPAAEDLTETLLYLQSMAITALITFDVDADDMEPDRTILRLYQVLNGLPSKEYYTRPAITEAYAQAIKQVLMNVLGEVEVGNVMTADERDERYEIIAHLVVDFETELAAIGLDLEELFDGSKTYHPFTLSDLQHLFTPLDFESFIVLMTGNEELPEEVVVTYPQYLIDLNRIIPRVPRETLQTYFLWKAIEVYAGHLDESVAAPVLNFRNTLRGISPSTRTERWKSCVSEVDSITGWILGKYYTDAAFSPEAKRKGEAIIINIKQAFIEKLNKLPWMDVQTKSVATEKVHNIVQKIGYPDYSPNVKSAESLAEYYKDLEISSEKFFDNYVSARKMAAKEEWASLHKPTDRAAWGMTPSTVNAYYNPPLGEIVFPAGILQSPVFSEHQPSYMNYGAFGAVAGHELSHAFDNQGREYDQYGRLHDWWSPQTSHEFDSRAQCFVDQYSKYTVVDEDGTVLHVNGKLTEGENIADNGGIAAAFQAWKGTEVTDPSPLLPGVNLTKEQLFFVNYARWWCGKIRPGAAAQRIYTDPHSPSFVRVLAVAEDSQDFIDAFKCANKKPQCVLW